MLPSSIQIEVTDAEIQAAEGKHGVYNECPAALALIKSGFKQIDVDDVRALLTTAEKQRIFCKTPKDLSIFIDNFDNDEEVKPAIFVLNEIRLALPGDERKPPSLSSDNLDKFSLEDGYLDDLEDEAEGLLEDLEVDSDDRDALEIDEDEDYIDTSDSEDL